MIGEVGAIADAQILEVRTGLGQPDDALVLDVAAALNVDLAQVFAVSCQVRERLVGDVGTAFANEYLELAAALGERSDSVRSDHITPGDVQMDQVGTPLGQSVK